MHESKTAETRQIPDTPTHDPAVDKWSPRLLALLARAASRVEPISKDATAKVRSQSGGEHSYDYTPSDVLVEYANRILASEGLRLVGLGWKREIGTNTHTIVAEFRLISDHGDMSPALFASQDCAPRKGTPADKSINSALTYCHGYIARGLLNIPREDAKDDRDRVNDHGYDPNAWRAKIEEQNRRGEEQRGDDDEARMLCRSLILSLHGRAGFRKGEHATKAIRWAVGRFVADEDLTGPVFSEALPRLQQLAAMTEEEQARKIQEIVNDDNVPF